MANEHSGSHSFDPNSTPEPRRQPATDPSKEHQHHDNRDDHDENDSRHVQSVIDRNNRDTNNRDDRREHEDRDHQARNDRNDYRDHDDRGRTGPAMVDPESVTTAQKEEHGGIKIGSAFFGWLTATGMTVLLVALVAAIGTGVGVVGDVDITKATDTATSNSKTVGIVGAIVLLVILLVSYYCGGYVAGRMARFNGVRQGVAVWVWAVVIAIALAILAAVAGEKYNILAKLNAFPRIPVNEGDLTTTGIVALVVVAVASLVGAILGGLAGMHYHRKVDRTGAVVIEDRVNRR